MEKSTNTCVCGCEYKFNEWAAASREKQKTVRAPLKRKRAATKPKTPAQVRRAEKEMEATVKFRVAHPRHPKDPYMNHRAKGSDESPSRRRHHIDDGFLLETDEYRDRVPLATHHTEALEAGFDPYEEEHIWDQGETVRTVTVRETTTRSYSEHLSQPEWYLDPRVGRAPVKEKGQKKNKK